MRARWIKIIADYARVALIIATVFILGVALVWEYFPEQVDRFDRYIIDQYFSHYESAFFDAEAAAKKDRTDGIAKFLAINEDLQKIAKQDRLATLKRQVFLTLIKLYREENMNSAALEMVDKWITFDNRDLTAKVSKAQLLYGVRKRKSEGLRLMKDLYKRYTDIPMVADSYDQMIRIEKSQ